MPRKPVSLPFALGALLALSLVWMAPGTSAGQVTPGDLAASETGLNPEGAAYEINPDAQGFLWISDNTASEIWAVEPETGAYTVFNGLGAVSDARHDGSGQVWWVDQENDRLGHLSQTGKIAAYWDLPGASIPLGTAIDAAGRVWVSDLFKPHVYSFDPGTRELCKYPYPTASQGGSDYLLSGEGGIWLGDWINNSILQLDPTTHLFASWQIPGDARPEGLSIDPQGGFWWADPDLDQIARLEPALDRLTQYRLPAGASSEMLTANFNQVWYTDDFAGTIGRLELTIAAGISTTLVKTTSLVTPTCALQGVGITATITVTTGTASWVSEVYRQQLDADGWTIYELPQDASPWGIAYYNRNIWFVDRGRQVVARFPAAVDVTGCKVEDADGDANTADDRTLMRGWTLYLTVDGVRQEPGQLTGTDGCTTWVGLSPEHTYGVEEALPAGWTALTPTSHDFGTVTPGEAYAFTFVNHRESEFCFLPLILR